MKLSVPSTYEVTSRTLYGYGIPRTPNTKHQTLLAEIALVQWWVANREQRTAIKLLLRIVQAGVSVDLGRQFIPSRTGLAGWHLVNRSQSPRSEVLRSEYLYKPNQVPNYLVPSRYQHKGTRQSLTTRICRDTTAP